ncbi:MAG: YHS domain-containing (seleno)protein [Bacteroidetes bacterium]|nr:YHS domain-containing (seleno)protein [Bacteroidota bacterium]MDA1121839.1 YHS domain-containing (seleno)protein [Bacteroidota bacterium]
MKIIISSILFCISLSGYSQETIRTKAFNLKDDLAIQGYDPVAYFVQRKAVEGKKEFQYSHSGVTYQFESDENRKLFQSNPDKYEPQYGGWCAYAMGATGEKVKVDPETFKIIDDKLYLFYNFYFTNTLKDWNNDESNLKSSADSKWSEIVNSVR